MLFRSYLARKAGSGRVMLGSDAPFPIGDPEPTKVVHAAHFSDGERAKILGATAQRVFRLRPDCLCHRASPIKAEAIKPGS